MVEAAILFKLLPTSILDIYNVFEPVVCCPYAYGCTLIPFHQPSWLQMREFWEMRVREYGKYRIKVCN